MRLQATLVRLRPDLQEVDFVFRIAVVLGVPDASTSAGELHFAALEVLEVAHAVLVF